MTDPRPAIAEQARAFGFDAVGFASAKLDRLHGRRLEIVTDYGLHGDMDWLATTRDRRSDPAALWPAARSAVMLGQNYGPADDPLTLLGQPDRGSIAAYARGRDYHDVIKKRLKRLAGWLVESLDCEVKVFVDTAPLLEKPLAAGAGLGWQGKHTNLVSRDFGSWLLLGAILTDADLPSDDAHADRCGDCRRCLDICPTRAFPGPYQLEARRCISYLTIEHKGPIPHEFRAAMGNRIFGCDDCLAVCPWNKFAARSREQALWARAELTAPRLADLLRLDDAAFRRVFAGSPIKRTGRDRFLRNVLIAAGNAADPALALAVRALLSDGAPIVRGAAVWALGRLLPAAEFEALAVGEMAAEGDPTVGDEWQQALREARMEAMAPPHMQTYYEHGFGQIESWPIAADEKALLAVLRDLFENYWRDIAFGPLIQGAAWEITAREAPRKLAMLDGYLTVDFGTWHFHLCIGEHKGSASHPTDPDLARLRRTGRAEFFRRINEDGAPDVWGVRLFNGGGEQQITILLPSPFLSREMKFLPEPDFSRLEAWDALRRDHLGLDPDPRDRTGTRLIHA